MTDEKQPVDQPTEPTPAEPAQAVPEQAVEPAYVRRRWMPGRSKAIIGGAAAGLLLVGGLGGFALGAATASGDDDGDRGRISDVDHRDGGPRGPGDWGDDSRFGDQQPGSNT